jgi:glyoxylase-like metal-dependent hydrolase (beta-lactamase superfamily II)
MIIETLPVGQLEANCYLLADEKSGEAMIIDPGDEPDRIIEKAEGLNVRYIVLTHGHFDHVGAVSELKEATGAEIAIHESDVEVYGSVKEHAEFWGFMLDPPPRPDILLKEGDEIVLGNLCFVVYHTPGHSPGSMCLYTNGVVITGDTLFSGSVGRTDFPGGDIGQMKESFRRLMGLPDDTAVLSGHGPATTIGRERIQNMFAAEFLG